MLKPLLPKSGFDCLFDLGPRCAGSELRSQPGGISKGTEPLLQRCRHLIIRAIRNHLDVLDGGLRCISHERSLLPELRSTLLNPLSPSQISPAASGGASDGRGIRWPCSRTREPSSLVAPTSRGFPLRPPFEDPWSSCLEGESFWRRLLPRTMSPLVRGTTP